MAFLGRTLSDPSQQQELGSTFASLPSDLREEVVISALRQTRGMTHFVPTDWPSKLRQQARRFDSGDMKFIAPERVRRWNAAARCLPRSFECKFDRYGNLVENSRVKWTLWAFMLGINAKDRDDQPTDVILPLSPDTLGYLSQYPCWGRHLKIEDEVVVVPADDPLALLEDMGVPRFFNARDAPPGTGAFKWESHAVHLAMAFCRANEMMRQAAKYGIRKHLNNMPDGEEWRQKHERFELREVYKWLCEMDGDMDVEDEEEEGRPPYSWQIAQTEESDGY